MSRENCNFFRPRAPISLKRDAWRSWTFPPWKNQHGRMNYKTACHQSGHDAFPEPSNTLRSGVCQECWMNSKLMPTNSRPSPLSWQWSDGINASEQPSTSSLWILIDISGIFQNLESETPHIHPYESNGAEILPPAAIRNGCESQGFQQFSFHLPDKLPSRFRRHPSKDHTTHSFDSMSPITYTTFLIFLGIQNNLAQRISTFCAKCVHPKQRSKIKARPFALLQQFCIQNFHPQQVHRARSNRFLKRELNELSGHNFVLLSWSLARKIIWNLKLFHSQKGFRFPIISLNRRDELIKISISSYSYVLWAIRVPSLMASLRIKGARSYCF